MVGGLDRNTTPARSVARQLALVMAFGLVATAVCLGAEAWLLLELLAVLPDGTATPAEIERLADIGKAIAGATGATLIIRGLLDRSARSGRVRRGTMAALAVVWLGIAAGIYQGLVVVTDAIVESLPAEARQDAVLIALYRKNVQEGTIADPDFGPGGTLDDLQRVKAINAAIGLLDRERDYARRSEGAIRSGAEARKMEIVRRAQAEAAMLRSRLDQARQPFLMLAEGRPEARAVAAWSAYEALWQAGPEIRSGLLASPGAILFPGWPDPPLPPLGLGDVPPGLTPESFAGFLAESLATRRDAGVWAIEDRALGALQSISHSHELVDPLQERQLVLAVVVPPIALSFGAAGLIANATALVLLVPGLVAAGLLGRRQGALLRLLRPASVVAPWIMVAAAIAWAPPVPFSDDQGFARIARQTREAPDVALWTDLWLRMIGVEAQLLSALPGRNWP